jgi:catechol 2,3-dioxygenase-like lactoylglutathione lyase family enzyme
MQIHHIGIWTNDLERLRDFYINAFDCKVSGRYDNPAKQFSSYFLTFAAGTSIEIMKRNDVTESTDITMIGLAHFALDLGTMLAVDQLTKKLEHAGTVVVSQPRITGDGYYESVICDPDKNKIELIAITDKHHSNFSGKR